MKGHELGQGAGAINQNMGRDLHPFEIVVGQGLAVEAT